MNIYTGLDDTGLVAALQAGQVGVIPTDTVYGLVCSASDVTAVGRLYSLKRREHKPGTVIAASIDQLAALGVKRRYLKAVERFWPGSVSIEIPHHIDYLSQATGRQGFRIPDNEAVLTLLRQTGPLQTTSANEPGAPPAVTLHEAQTYFGDTIDFYAEGGNLAERQPSTLIKVVDDAIEIIRQGAVRIDPKMIQ